MVALEIAYLPALYNQFATRETEVTLLERAVGNPAWGPEILARAYWLDTMDELPPLYSRLGALGRRGLGEPRQLPRR